MKKNERLQEVASAPGLLIGNGKETIDEKWL